MQTAPFRRIGGRYGLTVVCVAAALALSLLLQPDVLVGPPFLLAVVVSAWFGGMLPGVVAAVLSTMAIDYFFLPPTHQLEFDASEVPGLVVFFVCAVLVSSWSAARRRAERLLREARDRQEAIVRARTRELEHANASLQQEIAERTRIEERLRGVADLLDLTHDGIFVCDRHDVVTYWNRGAAELYGWTAEEAVGRVSHELLRTVFPVPLDAINGELLATGRWDGELLHTTRDGRQLVVASRWSLQGDQHGDPAATMKTNNDVTARKNAEETLYHAQVELGHVTRLMTIGEMTSSIAHEVNQPLAAIVTNGGACLRWLATDPPNLDEVRDGLLRIIDDGNRAGEVTARIRALVKTLPPATERVDINQVIRNVLTIGDVEARRQGVTVRTMLAADLPLVLGHHVRLQLVVLNLVMNGIDATKHVTDRARELIVSSGVGDAGTVVVSVRDSGIGIDVGNVDRLFDAFHTSKPEGMGIGLSISRSIVEAQGGRLWAESADDGAVFHFTLRTADAPAA